MNTSLGLVIDTRPGWTEEVTNLVPGAHVAVLADDATVSIEGRLAGLHLRDTILVLRPGPTTGFVFLFRKPIVEGTVAAQALATGTGAMNIDECRVGTAKRTPGSLSKKSLGGFGERTGRVGQYESDSGHNPNIGRWPTNMVLVHGVGCGVGGCEPRCAVELLDAQSGTLRAGWFSGAEKKGMGFHGAANDEADGSKASRSTGDSGGASRFFPQFKDEGEMHAWISRLVGGSGYE